MQRGDNDDHPIDAHFDVHGPFNIPEHYDYILPDHYHYDLAGYDHDHARYVYYHLAHDGNPPLVDIYNYSSACFHDFNHCRSLQRGDDWQYPHYREAPNFFYSEPDLSGDDVIGDPYLYGDDRDGPYDFDDDFDSPDGGASAYNWQ